MNSAHQGIHFEKLGWHATDALTKGSHLQYVVYLYHYVIVGRLCGPKKSIVVELNVQLFTKLCLDKKV